MLCHVFISLVGMETEKGLKSGTRTRDPEYSSFIDPLTFMTFICCKTLEHILVSNINKHLAFESIPAYCHHGFRSLRSYETQLVQFYHNMVSNLDRALNRGHRQTDVIIMDFANAFDKVPHKMLLYK